MTPRQTAKGKVYIATESFVANIDGVDQNFIKDKTRVREGHVALDRWPQWFEEIDADYEVS